MSDFDATFFEHSFAGFCAVSVGIFVVSVDYFFDAGLNNGFGAFVAGEEGYVKCAIVHIGDAIEDSVKFGMANVGVFGV